MKSEVRLVLSQVETLVSSIGSSAVEHVQLFITIFLNIFLSYRVIRCLMLLLGYMVLYRLF